MICFFRNRAHPQGLDHARLRKIQPADGKQEVCVGDQEREA